MRQHIKKMNIRSRDKKSWDKNSQDINSRDKKSPDKQNRRKESDFDDGRVIADMSIDGMPRPILRRPAPKTAAAPGVSGFVGARPGEDAVKLTKREYYRVTGGIAASYIFFGVMVFGIFALFILFCTKIWFR